MVGTYHPTEGRIIFRGEDITNLHPFHRVQRGLSIKFQIPGIFLNLPTEQNLRIALQRACTGEELETELERLLGLVDLRPYRQEIAGNLSHGLQQWLEIGMALGVKPALLFLDEPTAGMSAEETYKTGELVKKLNAEGMTIVVIEHDMTFIRQIGRAHV